VAPGERLRHLGQVRRPRAARRPPPAGLPRVGARRRCGGRRLDVPPPEVAEVLEEVAAAHTGPLRHSLARGARSSSRASDSLSWAANSLRSPRRVRTTARLTPRLHPEAGLVDRVGDHGVGPLGSHLRRQPSPRGRFARSAAKITRYGAPCRLGIAAARSGTGSRASASPAPPTVQLPLRDGGRPEVGPPPPRATPHPPPRRERREGNPVRPRSRTAPRGRPARSRPQLPRAARRRPPGRGRQRRAPRPIRPDERLVMTRTASIGSRVGPAVMTIRTPSSGPRGGSAASAAPRITSTGASFPSPISPSARNPVTGSTTTAPRALEQPQPLPDRRLLPHRRIHRRRDEKATAVRERVRREGRSSPDTGGDLGDHVRGGRDDQEKVGLAAERDVVDAGVDRVAPERDLGGLRWRGRQMVRGRDEARRVFGS